MVSQKYISICELIVIAVVSTVVSILIKKYTDLGITLYDFILLFVILSVMYLIFTGRIKEFSYGSISLKLHDYSTKKIEVEKNKLEEIRFVVTNEDIDKKGIDYFLEKLPKIKSGLERDLVLFIEEKPHEKTYYKSEVLKKYLMANLFKYAVFKDKYGCFEAYMSAKILYGLLELEEKLGTDHGGVSIVEKINKWDIHSIPCVTDEHIFDITSTKDAIVIMDSKKLEYIAVLDERKHFLGIINKDKLRLRVADKAVALLQKE